MAPGMFRLYSRCFCSHPCFSAPRDSLCLRDWRSWGRPPWWRYSYIGQSTMSRCCSPLSVVYFTPFYLLGINVSIDRERVLRHLAGREWLLGIALLGLSVIQVASFPDYRNMHKPALAWGGIDLNIPQKMLECLVFYSLFSRVERLNQPFLKTLATDSFALFFLHAPVIEILTRLTAQEWLRSLCGRLPGSIVWVFWILVVTLLSYGIAVVIRRLLPGQSRRVIGW